MLQQVGAPGEDQAIEAFAAINGQGALVDGHKFGQVSSAIKRSHACHSTTSSRINPAIILCLMVDPSWIIFAESSSLCQQNDAAPGSAITSRILPATLLNISGHPSIMHRPGWRRPASSPPAWLLKGLPRSGPPGSGWRT